MASQPSQDGGAHRPNVAGGECDVDRHRRPLVIPIGMKSWEAEVANLAEEQPHHCRPVRTRPAGRWRGSAARPSRRHDDTAELDELGADGSAGPCRRGPGRPGQCLGVTGLHRRRTAYSSRPCLSPGDRRGPASPVVEVYAEAERILLGRIAERSGRLDAPAGPNTNCSRCSYCNATPRRTWSPPTRWQPRTCGGHPRPGTVAPPSLRPMSRRCYRRPTPREPCSHPSRRSPTRRSTALRDCTSGR